MNQSDKFKEIIKERNNLIEYYKEKCDGLEQLCDLLRCLLFAIINANKNSIICKNDIKKGMGKNLIGIREDNDSYYVSVCPDDSVVGDSESDEENEI